MSVMVNIVVPALKMHQCDRKGELSVQSLNLEGCGLGEEKKEDVIHLLERED